MAMYDIAQGGLDDDTDPLTEELDDLEIVGRTPRCLVLCRRSCPCITKTKRRRVTWCVVCVLIFMLCLAAGGAALGLYYKGFFIPQCQRASSFSLDDAHGPFYWSDSLKPLDFNYTWSACNNTLMADSNLTVPLDGIYFFSLSVGSERYYPVGYYVVDQANGETITQLIRKSVAHNTSDVLGKNALVKLEKGQKLHVSYNGSIFDKDDNILTSWGGFRITDMFSPLYLVSSALTEPQTDPGTVLFDDILINTVGGTLFNTTNGAFSAVEGGVYFFSFTTGVPPHQEQNVTIDVNDVPIVTVYRGGKFTNGTDTLDRSVLVKLSKDDKVTLNLGQGQIFSSPEGKETTFFGFKYNPTQGPRHCWSAFLDHSWTSANNGSLDPIPLKIVTVNEGDLFNTQNSTVTIKVAGVYYVYASVGLQPGHKGYVRIMHNDEIVGSVARFEGYQNGEDQIGRGALVRAEVGDTLHLWEDACPGCAIKADGKHRQTSFLGFLVHRKLD